VPTRKCGASVGKIRKESLNHRAFTLRTDIWFAHICPPYPSGHFTALKFKIKTWNGRVSSSRQHLDTLVANGRSWLIDRPAALLAFSEFNVLPTKLAQARSSH